MIHYESQDGIAVLILQHGKVNAIDLEFLQELDATLHRVSHSADRAVIVTGSGSVFSAGVDLFRVLNGGASYIEEFLPVFSRVFERFFLFPKPVVCATNGHAIAGGCILHCACDYRIMAEGAGRIGVPELLVGVPFPAVALEMVRFAIPTVHLHEILYGAETYFPHDALKMGLTDEVVPVEELMERARDIARKFARYPLDSFRMVKHLLRQPAMEQARAASNEREILAAWSSPDIHAIIRDYLARTLGKSG